MRVLIVEDEPLMADAIRDGLRLEAIAADIAGDGDTALKLLSFNAYDIAVLDRDIPGPIGDEVAGRIVASGRSRLAEHAPLAQGAGRGAARPPPARSDPRSPRRDEPGARGLACRLGGPGAARRARYPLPARAALLRPARHVRGAVRPDRADRRPLPRGGAPAREPRAPPASGRERSPRRRPHHAASGGRCLSGGRARGGLRGTARST